MRFFICLLLGLSFAAGAHADETHEYIQVHCDPEKKIFQVRELVFGRKIKAEEFESNPSLVKTPGEIFGKRDGIIWEESDNYDVILVKESTLDIPSCTLQEFHDVVKSNHNGKSYPNGIKVKTTSQIEFKVVRTKIDQGNVQRQCGAALGAAFKVFVNDVPLGYFPSAKDRCFETNLDSETVSYSHSNGLRHCENPNPHVTHIPEHGKFKTKINVCRTGRATHYLEYLNTNKTHSDEPSDQDSDQDIVSVIQDQTLTNANRTLHILASRAKRELRSEKLRLEKLAAKADIIKKERDALKQQHDKLKQEKDALQEDLKAERGKSFWKRVFNK